MVTFKPTVRFKALTPGLLDILESLYLIDKNFKNFPEIVVTSVNDSNHMKNSRHYTNEAVDIRAKTFTDKDQKKLFMDILSNYLGKKFTILHESEGTPNEHFHVQVKKGLIYE